MSTSGDVRNPVEFLAEEFLDRKRRGEQPTLREYLERHPDLAAEIRDLFPALLMMEDLGESSDGTTGSLAAENGAAAGVRLQRLGDYRILREIGRGGMGVVYEAEQESLGRRVALKVLSAGSLLDPKQVRRFEREAKAAAKLHHTNIVPVFGVGRQDGHHYFVMQFIAGLGLDVVLDDLRRLRQANSGATPVPKPVPAASQMAGLTGVDVARSLLTGRFGADGPPGDGSVTEPFDGADSADSPPTANGPMADSGSSTALLPGSSELTASTDPDRQFYRGVARIGIQVAEALEYANRQGILHRDVKPSNLLLDNRGNVWVADFGLAKTAEADDLTHTGDILGTIRYMAPERFSGHCDARSDVYSLGLSLYELVALKPAYEASDRHRLMERVLHEEPERLKKLAPGVPRDLETIVSKSIARDPAVRYATAAALAEDLRRYVDDRPIRARRISAAERLVRWCRRNKRLAVSIGVSTTALVVAVVVSLLYADRQTRLAETRTLYALEQQRRASEQSEAQGIAAGLAENYRSQLAESNRRLARLHLERGRAAFEKGQVGVGMLWTVKSLRTAAAAEDEAGQRVALANLSAWRRHHVKLKGVFTHGGSIEAAAFSPDGKTIATGGGGRARLWYADTGQPLGEPLVHPLDRMSLSFNPDGKTILTAGSGDSPRLWETATGRLLGQALNQTGPVASVTFSPDGNTFVAGSFDNVARLWETATGRPIGQALKHAGWVFSVSFSPDGKTIVTGSSDKKARLWDAETGRAIGEPVEHPGPVYVVAFSPDGRTILTGCQDKMARQWDVATGRLAGQPMEHAGEVRSVAFSPNGRLVLTGSFDQTARLWDAVTGQPLGRPMVHQAAVYSAAFSPDGRSILTASEDGTARLWDCEAGQTLGRLLEYESDGPAEALISDGKTLFTVGRGPAEAFSSDGKTLLTAGRGGKVWRWDTASGQRRGQAVTLARGIAAMALSRDGTAILTASHDKEVRLWDAASGRPLGRPIKHEGAVFFVALSPDGKTVLTGCRDKAARLWDVASGRPLGMPIGHREMLSSLALSPDGQTVLTGSLDRTARLWDARSGRPIGQPMRHSDAVLSVAFSPDGKILLTGSQDKTARMWDATTGEPIGQPLAHSGEVRSVAFSPDGKMIVTSVSVNLMMPRDHEAQVWDVATAQPIGPPMPHSQGMAFVSVRLSPDGRFLLTSDGRTARLWDAPTPLPGDLPRLAAWVEVATGLELDDRDSISVLDGDAWRDRQRLLEPLGGPPPDLEPRLDPILFGAHPEARGDALAARSLWDEAEAAYASAAEARPLNASWFNTTSVWSSRTRYYLTRGRPERAVSTLSAAVTRWPESLDLRFLQCYALLATGDRIGWERAIASLLDRFQGPMSPDDYDTVAWLCALGPYTLTDPESPVRLAEAAIRDATEFEKSYWLNTLGAALYRAGRFDEAIRRMEEGIQLWGGGQGRPADWLFLAMAHHRLGHRDLAHRWLERMRDYQPSESPDQFPRELEIRLLRSEAEAVVVYDPVFPADPFAH
jgi:eukaryotic-like serine/threonine-protein kinase